MREESAAAAFAERAGPTSAEASPETETQLATLRRHVQRQPASQMDAALLAAEHRRIAELEAAQTAKTDRSTPAVSGQKSANTPFAGGGLTSALRPLTSPPDQLRATTVENPPAKPLPPVIPGLDELSPLKPFAGTPPEPIAPPSPTSAAPAPRPVASTHEAPPASSPATLSAPTRDWADVHPSDVGAVIQTKTGDRGVVTSVGKVVVRYRLEDGKVKGASRANARVIARDNEAQDPSRMLVAVSHGGRGILATSDGRSSRVALAKPDLEGDVSEPRLAPKVPLPIPPPRRFPPSAVVKVHLNDPKLREEAMRALLAVDFVHDDGELPVIHLVANPLLKATLAQYVTRGSIVEAIELNPAAHHTAYDLLEEMGHFLDHQALDAYTLGYASEKSPKLAPWRQAALDSPPVKRLVKELKKAQGWHRRRLQEAGRQREIFARSYAQYVAIKCGDPVILAGLQGDRRSPFGDKLYWSEVEFAPIMQALDKLFTNLNWQ